VSVAGLGKGMDASVVILREFLRCSALGVIEIPKETGATRAVVATRGIALPRGGYVTTERAFLHNSIVVVEVTHPVRTGVGAVLAADAGVFVDEYHAGLLVTIGGSGRAHSDTGGILALLAEHRQPIEFDIREGAGRTDGYYMVPKMT
jgi:hypothetical protein